MMEMMAMNIIYSKHMNEWTVTIFGKSERFNIVHSLSPTHRRRDASMQGRYRRNLITLSETFSCGVMQIAVSLLIVTTVYCVHNAFVSTEVRAE